MEERIVKVTPAEFASFMNGHSDTGGAGYQMSYKSDDEGNITSVNLSPHGEIKDGQEFSLRVVIEDLKK